MKSLPEIFIRDIGDIIDRYSISKLKSERINKDESHREYVAFCEGINYIKETYSNIEWDILLKMMIDINSNIWFLEAAMKSGKQLLPNEIYLDDPKNKEVLASIGKNSILIRNMNHLRVQLKNYINSTVKQGFMDSKTNHMSE